MWASPIIGGLILVCKHQTRMKTVYFSQYLPYEGHQQRECQKWQRIVEKADCVHSGWMSVYIYMVLGIVDMLQTNGLLPAGHRKRDY